MIAQFQRYADVRIRLRILARELLYYGEKTVFYPLQHKAIWRLQNQFLAVHLRTQRLDPCLELLLGQGALKMLKAATPEGIHRGGIGGRATSDRNTYYDRRKVRHSNSRKRSYPQSSTRPRKAFS